MSATGSANDRNEFLRSLRNGAIIGALVLVVAAFASSLALFAVSVFFWGACGGVAMTMSRTIMQMQAPEAQRGRIMSFYALSFQGAGPLGALLNGVLVDQFGPQQALMMCGVLMTLIMVVIGVRSGLWRFRGHAPSLAGGAVTAPSQPQRTDARDA